MFWIGTEGARGLWKLTARESRFSELTDRLGSAHRVERAGDELCRTRSIQVVSGLCLEQFGVRHDDPDIRNVTYNNAAGRFCLIDFELATILPATNSEAKKS